jgi:hypothetical protein
MGSKGRLLADDRGVWREHGSIDGIEWGDVCFVVAFRQDGHPGVRIAFGFDVPMIFGISDDEPGFDEVMRAVLARLPGCNPRWRQEAERLLVGGQVDVWHRAEPGCGG